VGRCKAKGGSLVEKLKGASRNGEGGAPKRSAGGRRTIKRIHGKEVREGEIFNLIYLGLGLTVKIRGCGCIGGKRI